ncbi:hypothetical protein [Oscillatoria acuminata]|uniref:hypothetical protein n=1 Tax=Oscillatoria acuminata TaxID=118323 RepID=UPI0002DA956C|nr:hypothetical protein [Oscillatoria acuminata]
MQWQYCFQERLSSGFQPMVQMLLAEYPSLMGENRKKYPKFYKKTWGNRCTQTP